MKSKLKAFVPAVLICSFVMAFSSVTVYAEPDDYLDDLWNDVSSAIDNFTNNDLSQPDITSPSDEPYTQPESDPYYDEPTEPEYTTEPPTETPTEEYVPIDDDNYHDDYDYSYISPTEATEDYYEPEVLTETYTDAPFTDRLSLSDAGHGNLFVALGVWASIIVGIIIVISIVIATHNRKKGNL